MERPEHAPKFDFPEDLREALSHLYFKPQSEETKSDDAVAYEKALATAGDYLESFSDPRSFETALNELISDVYYGSGGPVTGDYAETRFLRNLLLQKQFPEKPRVTN